MELHQRWLLGVEHLLLGVEFLSFGIASPASVGLPATTALAAAKGAFDFITLATSVEEKHSLFEEGLLRPPAINDPPQARQSTTWERKIVNNKNLSSIDEYCTTLRGTIALTTSYVTYK